MSITAPATTTVDGTPQRSIIDKEVGLAILLEKANCFLKVGDLKTAKELFQQVLDENPFEPKAFVGLGKICGRQWKASLKEDKPDPTHLEEAKQYYDRAIELDPLCIDAWGNKFVLLRNHTKDTEPLSVEGLNILVDFEWSAMVSKFLNLYPKTMKEVGENLPALRHFVKSLIYYESKNFDSAKREVDLAYASNPTDKILNEKLALQKIYVLNENGDYTEVIPLVEDFVKKYPIHPDLSSVLGVKFDALFLTGKHSEALKFTDDVPELLIYRPHFLFKRIRILIGLNNHKQAENELDNWISNNPVPPTLKISGAPGTKKTQVDLPDPSRASRPEAYKLKAVLLASKEDEIRSTEGAEGLFTLYSEALEYAKKAASFEKKPSSDTLFLFADLNEKLGDVTADAEKKLEFYHKTMEFLEKAKLAVKTQTLSVFTSYCTLPKDDDISHVEYGCSYVALLGAMQDTESSKKVLQYKIDLARQHLISYSVQDCARSPSVALFLESQESRKIKRPTGRHVQSNAELTGRIILQAPGRLHPQTCADPAYS